MGYILMSKYITCILKITPPEEISAVADELKWLFDKGGGDKPPEEFLGRCNSPIHPSGYVRVAVLEDYAPAIEYLKATVHPVIDVEVVSEEPIKGGGKVEVGMGLKEGPIEMVKPQLMDCFPTGKMDSFMSEKLLAKYDECVAFCDAKIVAMAEPLEEPIEGEPVKTEHLIEIIDVEWDGQKMFQVGTVTDLEGNEYPEYLGLIGMCPMYVEPTLIEEP
jgi:hypothetical protein